jgi:hypothetical protein
MKCKTHQRWNHPKIIIILGPINKTKLISINTIIITADKIIFKK